MDEHASHTPLHLAVCNLYDAERLTSYPGGATWDVNLRTNMKYKTYPKEFAFLREKLAKLQIPEEPDWIRLGRVHHQSTRARGRNWHPTPEYLFRVDERRSREE